MDSGAVLEAELMIGHVDAFGVRELRNRSKIKDDCFLRFSLSS